MTSIIRMKELYNDYSLHCDFKLDPVKKKSWIEALRSGQYKQCSGVLHYDLSNSYCCLGIYRKVNSIVIFSEVYIDDSEIPSDVQMLLAAMNDGNISGIGYHSFASIADWIERNL